MSDVPNRLAADETNGSPKSPDFIGAQAGRGPARVDARTPEYFVSHPIADAREASLQEERRLDWQLSVS
jgi:hypothetical protein